MLERSLQRRKKVGSPAGVYSSLKPQYAPKVMIKITNLRFTPLPPYLLTTLFPYGPYNMASIPIKFLKLLFQKNSMTQKCTTHIPQEGSAAQLQEMWFAEHLQLMYLQDPPQPITEQGGNIISPQPGSLLTGCLCSSTPSFVKSISWV